MKKQRRSQRWIRIRQIGVVSAFKYGCFMSLWPFLCVTISFCSLISGIVPSGYIRDATGREISINYGLGNILALLPIFVLIGLAVSLGPAVSMAVHAIIYNIFGRMFGGIALRIDETAALDEEPSGDQFGVSPDPRHMSEDDYVRAMIAERKRKRGIS